MNLSMREESSEVRVGDGHGGWGGCISEINCDWWWTQREVLKSHKHEHEWVHGVNYNFEYILVELVGWMVMRENNKTKTVRVPMSPTVKPKLNQSVDWVPSNHILSPRGVVGEKNSESLTKSSESYDGAEAKTCDKFDDTAKTKGKNN